MIRRLVDFKESLGTTMVDKIPWDTSVIVLIFDVFKTEFKRSSVIRFKMRCSPPPPPIQRSNSGERACIRVQHCRRGGGGAEQV